MPLPGSLLAALLVGQPSSALLGALRVCRAATLQRSRLAPVGSVALLSCSYDSRQVVTALGMRERVKAQIRRQEMIGTLPIEHRAVARRHPLRVTTCQWLISAAVCWTEDAASSPARQRLCAVSTSSVHAAAVEGVRLASARRAWPGTGSMAPCVRVSSGGNRGHCVTCNAPRLSKSPCRAFIAAHRS